MAFHDRSESEWDELLAARCEPSSTTKATGALRRAVLDRSTRVLRRRRRVRRFVLVAALATCYAAGVASARLDGSSAGNAPPSIADAGVTGSVHTSSGATGSAGGAKPEPANYIRLVGSQEPSVTQSKPARKPPSRFEQLRRISDRYLYEGGDVTTAIRCYRKALDVATEEELAIATDKDSWLLIALKQERMQERRYEDRST